MALYCINNNYTLLVLCQECIIVKAIEEMRSLPKQREPAPEPAPLQLHRLNMSPLTQRMPT